VVLGGLVSTTLVTLFLLPALHLALPGGQPDESAEVAVTTAGPEPEEVG
jgi:hypothetical protein